MSITIGPSVHPRAGVGLTRWAPHSSRHPEDVTNMQPLAAYYLFIVNDKAREGSRRPTHRPVPPKRTASTRVRTGLATIFRPIRRSASAA